MNFDWKAWLFVVLLILFLSVGIGLPEVLVPAHRITPTTTVVGS